MTGTVDESVPARALVRIAERHNRKRAFLLVSTVLGKHLPVDASACRLAGLALGLAVDRDARAGAALQTSVAAAEAGPGSPAAEAARTTVDSVEAAPARAHGPYAVVGFAETATALGEQVASAIDAVWWQTTTRQARVAATGLPFDEPHSHAPEQWIAEPPEVARGATLVLVDDELTTGRTACNLIEVLHARQPRPRYVIAALLDGRAAATGMGSPAGEGDPIAALAVRLGVTIDVVALATRPPEGRTTAGWSGGELATRPSGALARAPVHDIDLGFDGPLQHDGQDRSARRALASLAREAASALPSLPDGLLVLGTGEHLAFAQRVAAQRRALTSSTTRSPVLVSQTADYPIRDGLAFANPDDLEVPGFAYNVLPAERPAIVVHFQDGDHRRRGQGLLDTLAARGAREIVAVTLAR